MPKTSLRELKKYIRPGARERGLALMLEFLMREKGARKAAFDTIVASGRNGAMPHASVTDRRIKQGDLVTIDFGAEADGYFSDITRTYLRGQAYRPSAGSPCAGPAGAGSGHRTVTVRRYVQGRGCSRTRI